jgi:nucleotide-binding universal stress UspA family protein
MELHHIAVATDESETGRHAVRVATSLAAQSHARLSVVTTLTSPVHADVPAHSGRGSSSEPALQRLAQWLGPELAQADRHVTVELAITVGLPGVEIARFAEERQADLLVLGRTERSQAHRLLSGDTADAVARRSRVPCLFVPIRRDSLRRVLAALDGTERGLGVLTLATDFARASGGSLRAVTVEPAHHDEPEPLATQLPSGRSARLAQALERLRISDPSTCAPWDGSGRGSKDPVLRIRRGDPVSEILGEVSGSAADVLTIGYHRGGPPGVLEAGSVARRLAHAAPCVLLTVPL